MNTTHFSTLLVILLLSTLFLTDTFAQDYTQRNLPEGAKARLGKGVISDIQLSPDNTRLAITSSIGIWLYDVNIRAQMEAAPSEVLSELSSSGTCQPNRQMQSTFTNKQQIAAATVNLILILSSAKM